VRFRRQNDKVEDILKNVENSDPYSLIKETWVDHRLPKVFVNRK
jgi:hypothetical protein